MRIPERLKAFIKENGIGEKRTRKEFVLYREIRGEPRALRVVEWEERKIYRPTMGHAKHLIWVPVKWIGEPTPTLRKVDWLVQKIFYILAFPFIILAYLAA